ncbi:MAG: sensor histidine kinase [Thermodesulfobacteriota bacterium]
MESAAEDTRPWQGYALSLYRQAAVGRLLRGFVHNLNGPLQVFSMHAELLRWMFSRALPIVDRLEAAELPEASREQVHELKGLLEARFRVMDQLQAEMAACQEIVRQIMGTEAADESLGSTCTLNTVIADELAFLQADLFFKHKVSRELRLAPRLPPLHRGVVPAHQIVFILLENAVDNLRQSETPRLTITTEVEGDRVLALFEDSGPPVLDADRERIFAPFFTTRPGHPGMGLFLGRLLASDSGGSLECETAATGSRFRLSLPAA